jgi:predicted RNase H-like nuclease (RuvC/YqgF family)
MSKSVIQLKNDVAWWEDEIRDLESRLIEGKRTLEQRKRELAEAENEEREKPQDPMKIH